MGCNYSSIPWFQPGKESLATKAWKTSESSLRMLTPNIQLEKALWAGLLWIHDLSCISFIKICWFNNKMAWIMQHGSGKLVWCQQVSQWGVIWALVLWRKQFHLNWYFTKFGSLGPNSEWHIQHWVRAWCPPINKSLIKAMVRGSQMHYVDN